MERSNPVQDAPESCLVRQPKEEWLANGLIENNLERPQGLIECDTVLDIGAGLRPMCWYTPKLHFCIEPYKLYVERLAYAGYRVIERTALQFLSGSCLLYEAIYLLDVIEHMDKEEGEEVIKLAIGLATKQVVIFTPHGFMQQTEDAWGLGGDYWQTHRSGWLPGEFPDWHTYRYAKGFFAVLTK